MSAFDCGDFHHGMRRRHVAMRNAWRSAIRPLRWRARLFAADPPSLLRLLRNENDKIEARLANYVATDPGLLPAVRKLAAEAPTSNKRAIGAALRKAELQCTAPQRMEPQPDAARKIIDFVRNLGDNAVLAGYVAVTEEPASPNAIGKPVKPPVRNDKLLTGEWKTELADPFASPPLPQ